MVTVAINGIEVHVDSIRVRAMNFGQGGYEHSVVRYTLNVPVETLIDQMDSYYAEFAKDDRECGGDDEPEIILRLRELAWPDLRDLQSLDPALFSAFVKRFLSYDFLVTLWKTDPSGRAKYLINTVDTVDLRGDTLVFSGDAIGLA